MDGDCDRRNVTLLLGLVVTASLVLSAADKHQPLQIKTGLWEVTTTVAPAPDLPVSAALLEKLTPEQRARLEDRMKAQSDATRKDAYKKTVTRQCITQEQLNRGLAFTSQRDTCRWESVDTTAQKAEARAECSNQGISNDATSEIEAMNPEEVRGTVAFNGPSHATTTTILTAKWISSTCHPK